MGNYEVENWEKLQNEIKTSLLYVIKQDITDEEKNNIIRNALLVGLKTLTSELKKYRFSYKKEIIMYKFVFFNPLRNFLLQDLYEKFYENMNRKIIDTNADLKVVSKISDYIKKADILNNLDFVDQLLEFLYFMFKQSFKRLEDAIINKDKIFYALRGIEYTPGSSVDLNEEQYEQELNNKLKLMLEKK